MSARVLVLGLDAAESTLIDRWAGEGMMPAFAKLAESGRVGRLGNRMDTLPGAIWPELTSGRSAGRVPLYFHPRQLRTGEARRRPIEPHEIDPEDYFWTIASRGGRRVAVVDQVQTVDAPDLDGLQVFEWGLHDRYFERRTVPEGLLAELERRHGPHPVSDRQQGGSDRWACDNHGGTPAGYLALRRRLLDGVDNKTEILLDLLGRERWDLFVGAWGETHCAGHQFWHFHEGGGIGDAGTSTELAHCLRDVYRRVDAGVGRLIEAAGEDAWVLVFASHGMGPYIGGYKLIPEVLVRLGLGSGGGSAASAAVRRAQAAVKRLPKRHHERLRWLAGTWPVRTLQTLVGARLDPLESPRTRATSLLNNRCGAIRWNVRGREPYGSVEPGEELDRLTELLRAELYALEQPGSGERIVRRVVTAAEAFGDDHHPDVPDLMVDFRSDLGPLTACRSERVGLVEIDPVDPNYPRTGDHTTASRLWIRGPGAAGGPPVDADVLDLAPTVLRLLDLEPPARLDGRAIPSTFTDTNPRSRGRIRASQPAGERRASSHSRPARPIDLARSGSPKRSPIASAQAAGLAAGTRSPVTPGVTISGSPPRSEASTGLARAKASLTTTGAGSSHSLGTTTSRAPRYSRARRSRSRKPSRRTWVSRWRATRRRASAAMGPSPAIRSGTRGSARAASSRVRIPFSRLSRPAKRT